MGVGCGVGVGWGGVGGTVHQILRYAMAMIL